MMKKIILLASLVLMAAGFVNAQNDCNPLFPETKGAKLIMKSYTAKNNLLSTTTYEVTEAYSFNSNSEADVDFTVTNWQGRMVDQGKVTFTCQNGSFYMQMANRYLLPETMLNSISTSVEVVADYLDYPNTFNLTYPFNSTFAMDEGQFTIRSKENKRDYVRVTLSNRSYEKNEQVTTPAGTFNASKITFNFEVYNHTDKSRTKFKGIEWYSTRAGIVRSETRDANNNLLNYTVLESLTR